jgi:hypothetical protein
VLPGNLVRFVPAHLARRNAAGLSGSAVPNGRVEAHPHDIVVRGTFPRVDCVEIADPRRCSYSSLVIAAVTTNE